MALPKGLGIGRAVARTSSLASDSLSVQIQKSRLYRIPREPLPSYIFNPKEMTHLGHCKYFSLKLRRLSQELIDTINKGLPYLAGPYPPGLLHAHHEKYRLINHVKIDTWRTGDESERDHQVAEENLRRLAIRRIPILEPESDKIPVMIISSKKRVHKLSVVRMQVNKKLWNAFDMAIKQLQGTADEVGKVSASLYMIMASEESHKAKVEDVTAEMIKMLQNQKDKQSRLMKRTR